MVPAGSTAHKPYGRASSQPRVGVAERSDGRNRPMRIGMAFLSSVVEIGGDVDALLGRIEDAADRAAKLRGPGIGEVDRPGLGDGRPSRVGNELDRGLRALLR